MRPQGQVQGLEYKIPRPGSVLSAVPNYNFDLVLPKTLLSILPDFVDDFLLSLA